MKRTLVTSDNQIITDNNNKSIVATVKPKEVHGMRKFQFKILTGATETECKQKYRDMAEETSSGSGIYVHDDYTFYLFDKGGKGYLGDTLLFGGDAGKFNILGDDCSYGDLKEHELYFVIDDCTVDDGQDPVVESTDFSAGSILYTDANGVPTDLSVSAFAAYMTSYVANTAKVYHSDSASIDEDFEGDDATLMTSGAVSAFVNALVDDVISNQSILSINFFKAVKPVTLTAADIASNPKVVTFQIGTDDSTGDPINATASLTNNDHEGDIGLVFQVQYGDEYDPTDNDGDEWIFVNLHGLIDTYIADSSALTTTMQISDDNSGVSGHRTKKIKVEVNKSQKTGADYEALLVTNLVNAIDTVILNQEDNSNAAYDPTAVSGDNLSPNKFISESQLADILAHVLVHFTQYTYVSGGTVEEEEGGEL
jgi:hypothetical protein